MNLFNMNKKDCLKTLGYIQMIVCRYKTIAIVCTSAFHNGECHV